MKIDFKKIKESRFVKALSKEMSKKAEGFSYVETLICIMVMMILTVVVGVASIKLIDRAKEAKCHKEIESFRQALEEYYAECGTLPSTEQGLKALWEKPYLYPVPSKWNGPYLDTEVPPDPWGNEYQYKTPGPNNLPYEIFSYGADGEKGGEGKNADIYSWKRRE